MGGPFDIIRRPTATVELQIHDSARNFDLRTRLSPKDAEGPDPLRYVGGMILPFDTDASCPKAIWLSYDAAAPRPDGWPLA